MLCSGGGKGFRTVAGRANSRNAEVGGRGLGRRGAADSSVFWFKYIWVLIVPGSVKHALK